MLRRMLSIVAAALVLTLGASAQTAAKQAKAKTTTESKADSSKAAATGDLVDINTASAAELDAIPGIGKVYSKKIIDGRPYVNKSQLVSKGVLPQKVYNKVSGKIVAKQK